MDDVNLCAHLPEGAILSIALTSLQYFEKAILANQVCIHLCKLSCTFFHANLFYENMVSKYIITALRCGRARVVHA